MKNKIQNFLFLFVFVMLGVANASAGIPMLNAVVYERASSEPLGVYEKDLNPIFDGGSSLDINTFNNYFNSDQRVIALTQGSRAIVDQNSDTLLMSDTNHFDIFNNFNKSGEELWVGETLNAGIVSAATEQFSVKLNYQYRYTLKNTKSIQDLAKKGNGIKKIGIETVVPMMRNRVYVVASCTAKSGNTRYIALSLTDAM